MTFITRIFILLTSILGIIAPVSAASAAGMHAEIYNLSRFTVYIKVANHPNLDGQIDPYDENKQKVSVLSLDLPKAEACDKSRPGFFVRFYDDKHRLAYQGCVFDGDKKYIIDK